MIQGMFDISVNTMKYYRRGTVALKSNEGTIAAELQVSDLEPMYFEGTCEDKEFTIGGSDEFGDLGRVDYTARGSVWGNSIDVKCETSIGAVTVFGTLIGASAGAVISSHDYIMAASTGDFTTGADAMYSGLYADGG